MGIQEGAEVGYSPHKPGRPLHTYHTYFIGNLRLALDVEVRPETEHAPRPVAVPASLPSFRTTGLSATVHLAPIRCEKPKPRACRICSRTKRVKGLIEKLFAEWAPAGQGWQGVDTTLQLQGWAASSGRGVAPPPEGAPAAQGHVASHGPASPTLWTR